MSCLRKADGTAISCTTTYQKWTGQPIHLAGSKNPLPLGMGSVKTKRQEDSTMIVKDYYEGKTHIIIDDKYCVKTKEEVDAILKAMGELVGRQLAQQQARRAAE